MVHLFFAETQYGFEWGPLKVERAYSHVGSVCITLKTPRQRMVVRVTPSGLIRVDEHGKAPSDD